MVLLCPYSASNVSGFQYITAFKSNKFEYQDQRCEYIDQKDKASRAILMSKLEYNKTGDIIHIFNVPIALNKDKKEAFKLIMSLVEELIREHKQSKMIVAGDLYLFLEENYQPIQIRVDIFLYDVT